MDGNDGETTIFHVKICNHPTETTLLKWMFGVPGTYECWGMVDSQFARMPSLIWMMRKERQEQTMLGLILSNFDQTLLTLTIV